MLVQVIKYPRSKMPFFTFLACLPPTVMLPPDRLGALITQAMEHQKQKCIYHNSQLDKDLESISILSDHSCTKHSFPCETKQILSEHCDEVKWSFGTSFHKEIKQGGAGVICFFLYKQPHFRVEPRVVIKIPKMRLKVAMKLLSIF